MGISLLDRDQGRGHLTDRGEIFQRHVCQAFEALRRGLEETVLGAPRLFRLHSAPSFAAGWLSPRLHDFLSQNPDIEIHLAVGAEFSDLVDSDFDADIVFGRVKAANVKTVPLAHERVTPVCSPEMAESISSPDDLLRLRLIQSENNIVHWSHWFEANGMAPPRRQTIRFDRSCLAIAAAADGLGIALESTLLASRELESGRLVTPLLGKAKDITYSGHHLVYRRERRPNALVTRFADWLQSEICDEVDSDKHKSNA